MCWAKRKKRKQIEERCRKALDDCNLEEIHEVALLYDKGNGVKQNQKYAFELFLYAAKLGYARSQRAVAICYEKGEGVTKYMPYAIEWYEKAVNNGDATAMCSLALCYYEGNGVKKDFFKTFSLLLKAAYAGDYEAQKFICGALPIYRKFKSNYKGFDLYTCNPYDVFSKLIQDAEANDAEALYDIYQLEIH